MTAIDASHRRTARRARARAAVARGHPAARERQRALRRMSTDDRVAAIVATALARAARRSVADEAITRALAAVGPAARRRPRLLLRAGRERRGRSRSTHEWHAPSLRADEAVAPVRAHAARGAAAAVPRAASAAAAWCGCRARTSSWRRPVEQLVAPDGDRALVLMPVVVEGVLIGIAGFAAAVGIDLGTGRHRSAAAGGTGRGAAPSSASASTARCTPPRRASARCATPRRWASSWRRRTATACT